MENVAFSNRKKEVNMPGGDRTGPLGQGPVTGRGMGFCRGFGGGFRRGPGYGRGGGIRFRGGFGNYFSDISPGVSEKTLIENEIRILKDQLAALEERLSKDKEE